MSLHMLLISNAMMTDVAMKHRYKISSLASVTKIISCARTKFIRSIGFYLRHYHVDFSATVVMEVIAEAFNPLVIVVGYDPCLL